MSNERLPRLKNVDKSSPPWLLNQFPTQFGLKLGREIIYLLATKSNASLEGPEWEEIFATAIGGQWKPSNIGLDDVAHMGIAWGAKSVKSPKPFGQKSVRLISGRNSPVYSFGYKDIVSGKPAVLGQDILSIWNERVSEVRKRFRDVRTVVLVKSPTLAQLAVFEFQTTRFEAEKYDWSWNARKNLEGIDSVSGEHKFTWQPHGSQFTIIEKVPSDCLLIELRIPQKLKKESVLRELGFDAAWVKIKRKG